jgi:tripartite-type tricarboxylate transporter receptor subunit TctC
LPHVQSGALRALGVSATSRLRVLPDIPPISDTVPGYAVIGWLGIGAPKGTPPEIVERLDREVNAALAEPAMRARMADLGSDPLPGSAGDFAKLIADETAKWAKVVKFAGLKGGVGRSIHGRHSRNGRCANPRFAALSRAIGRTSVTGRQRGPSDI